MKKKLLIVVLVAGTAFLALAFWRGARNTAAPVNLIPLGSQTGWAHSELIAGLETPRPPRFKTWV